MQKKIVYPALAVLLGGVGFAPAPLGAGHRL